MQSQILISAATSGSGKTTLTLGLLRALERRGLRVQPFKCGPDYIDPQYHCLAARRESVNLDPFMASREHLCELYARYAAGANVCVAEGAMGLFDGYQASRGSSAEVAQLLPLSVVLIVDARATAYSVAPLLWGYKNFCLGVEIVGVIFNRVASASHYVHLQQAAHDAGVEALGYLPRDDAFVALSRHLGLSLENLEAFDPVVDAIADAMEKHVDLGRLLELTRRRAVPRQARESVERGTLRIAVARDEAFNFIYRANTDRLEQLGEVRFFSPVHEELPPEADLIYLPGGYPEFFARELAANTTMRAAIKEYVERGGRMIAECGGMIYLCRSLCTADGVRPMCGVLPLDATMEGMRLTLGYREVHYGGHILRGHEFHYSHVRGSMPSAARQFSARGEEVETPLYRYKNLLAGYTHLYWAECDPMELFST